MKTSKQRELLIDQERLMVVVSSCKTFEQLANMIDWVEIILSQERYPDEKSEVIEAMKAVLMDHLQYQKDNIAQSTDEKIVDMVAGAIGKHF